MGQKVNPRGFRLITTQKYLSNWYAKKTEYASMCQEDHLIREKIKKKLKHALTLAEIEINRTTAPQSSAGLNEKNNVIGVTINCLYPRSKDFLKNVVDFLQQSNIPNATDLLRCKNLKEICLFYLENQIKDVSKIIFQATEKVCCVKINFIFDVFENATLIAKEICKQLEVRMPFRRVIKKCIQTAQALQLGGLKIQVSGRLNGVEIARTEWQIFGKMSLHTLRSEIAYAAEEAHTIFGTIGVKIWLNKN